MKYNIYINQFALAESGLDLQACAILDYIKSICSNTSQKVIDKKNGDFYWIALPEMIRQMPLLGISTTSGISKKIKKVKDAGYVDTKIVRQKEGIKSFIYVRLTPKAKELEFITPEKQAQAKILQEAMSSPTGSDNRVLQESNNNTSYTNTNIHTSEQVKPVHECDFSFEGYIKQVMDSSFIVIDDTKRLTNPARYFAAYFLKRKGLKFNSREAIEGAMKRHYKAAKELGAFTSDMKRVSQAFNDAENLVVNGQRVNWGLETVVKMLTK